MLKSNIPAATLHENDTLVDSEGVEIQTPVILVNQSRMYGAEADMGNVQILRHK